MKCLDEERPKVKLKKSLWQMEEKLVHCVCPELWDKRVLASCDLNGKGQKWSDISQLLVHERGVGMQRSLKDRMGGKVGWFALWSVKPSQVSLEDKIPCMVLKKGCNIDIIPKWNKMELGTAMKLFKNYYTTIFFFYLSFFIVFFLLPSFSLSVFVFSTRQLVGVTPFHMQSDLPNSDPKWRRVSVTAAHRRRSIPASQFCLSTSSPIYEKDK